MLFADNILRHIYNKMYRYAAILVNPSLCSPLYCICQPLFFTYLENQLLLLVVQIPIHSCPWFAIKSSHLAASPTPRHQLIKLHIYIDDINISHLVWYNYGWPHDAQDLGREKVKMKTVSEHCTEIRYYGWPHGVLDLERKVRWKLVQISAKKISEKGTNLQCSAPFQTNMWLFQIVRNIWWGQHIFHGFNRSADRSVHVFQYKAEKNVFKLP
jgi:hypothetical protein